MQPRILRPPDAAAAWPGPRSAPTSGALGGRFLRLLAGLIGAALLLQGALVLLVDPYSLYGSPLALPRLRPVRLVKLDLLRRSAPPPEALVLGSSRVRMLPPDEAGRRFGLRFFHLGGPKSSPQNWLALTRYVVDELGDPVRLLLIGVDPSSFVDVPNYLHHPANAPELRRHLRHPWLAWLRSRSQIWSPHQAAAAATVLVRAARGAPGGPVDPEPARRADGFSPAQPALDPAAITGTEIALHRERNGIQPEHLADFAALLDYAAARGIRVVAYLTPEAPALRAALARTHHPATVRATRALLQQAGARGLTFCDVDPLGLGRADFVDPHHPSPAAGRRIVAALHACAAGDD